MSIFGDGSWLGGLGLGGMFGGGGDYQRRREQDEKLRRLMGDHPLLQRNGILGADASRTDESARAAAPQGERVNCRVIGDRG